MAITLINNTKSVAKIGYLVTVDPVNPQAFVYATQNSTRAIGIVTESSDYRKPCKIATIGDKCKVYVVGNVVKDVVIRGAKSGDNISLGANAVVKSSDTSYLKIGTALTSGGGLIETVLELVYSFGGNTTIGWNDIGNPPTRVVTNTTTELTTDYSIVCNRATAMTVNLLPATGSNRVRQISSIGLGVVTLDCDGTDTIDDETTQSINQWETIGIKDYAVGKFKIV